MRQPSNLQWWLLVIAALLIVAVWPPRDDKSLAAKFVNWAVDPWDQLPVLSAPLVLGQGDDPDEVHAHDCRCSSTTRCISRADGPEDGSS